MLNQNHKTWVEISRSSIESNVKAIRGLLSPATKLMAVVKSNGYGHGLVGVSKIFSENKVDWFGVDNIDEALQLRNFGITNPILVIGFTDPSRFFDAENNNIKLTIYNKETLPFLADKKLGLHLKVDTGMSRQGVMIGDLPDFIKRLPPKPKIEGLFTHFANADDLNDRSYPNLQLANFRNAILLLEQNNIYPQIKHAAATNATLTMPESHFDMTRIGIAFYGLWSSQSFREKFDKELKLKPVLSWKTRIVQLKNIKKNTPIGYGISESAVKDSKIAILPVGYFDGFDRRLSSIGQVLIEGKRCKVLGKVSMNLSAVDVSNVKGVAHGSEVVIIGSQNKETITAEEIADKLGTISYEIVARINPILPRIYV